MQEERFSIEEKQSLELLLHDEVNSGKEHKKAVKQFNKYARKIRKPKKDAKKLISRLMSKLKKLSKKSLKRDLKQSSTQNSEAMFKGAVSNGGHQSLRKTLNM